jgi:hypothetical protein
MPGSFEIAEVADTAALTLRPALAIRSRSKSR